MTLILCNFLGWFEKTCSIIVGKKRKNKKEKRKKKKRREKDKNRSKS